MTADAHTGARATHWARLSALFDGALTLPESERPAWLLQACPDDAALRQEAGRMLAAHGQDGGILDRRPDDLHAQLTAALKDEYAIDRELGHGGAAVVYLAHERKHGRQVVLKVLRPNVGAWLGPLRFLREVHIAASLAHPHIVSLLDSGNADGLLYYVMPYLGGETLRTRLQRVRRLADTEGLPMLRALADAMAYAHARGVVHRDIKPENVLIAGEHAYLLDFGIAKLATAPTDGVVTQDGLVVGTLAYMAPEQRAGDGTLDGRTDIYAWGVVAQEMLTGALPRAAAGHASLEEQCARVPALAVLVRQCLAVDAQERPASADALLAGLAAIESLPSGSGATVASPAPSTGASAPGASGFRSLSRRTRILAGGGVLAVIAAIAYATGRRGDTAVAGVNGPVLVAALVNETGDTTLDAWGRLAGDWITQGLHETGAVPVVPWPTALSASQRLQAKGSSDGVDAVRALGEETSAGTVVSGTYYLVGDSLHFQIAVTDVATHNQLGAPPAVVVPRDSGHAGVRLLRDRLMSAIAIWSNERTASVPDLARRPPTYEAYQVFDRALTLFTGQRYGESAP
ncbi:MAG: serine/threonine-protein kinase [Gemmatimonadota bacterium]